MSDLATPCCDPNSAVGAQVPSIEDLDVLELLRCSFTRSLCTLLTVVRLLSVANEMGEQRAGADGARALVHQRLLAASRASFLHLPEPPLRHVRVRSEARLGYDDA